MNLIQRSLMDKIDLAKRACNMSSDASFKQENCECDPSVNHCPCPYCAIMDALDFAEKQLTTNRPIQGREGEDE